LVKMRMVGQPQVRGESGFESRNRELHEASTGLRNVELLWGRPKAWRSRRDRRTPEQDGTKGRDQREVAPDAFVAGLA
jgi:hypothetical protein